MRETKINRVREREEEIEKESAERLKLIDIKERIGSIRTTLNVNEIEEEDFEEEKKYEELRKTWLRDFLDIFKENLTKEDRLKIPPI